MKNVLSSSIFMAILFLAGMVTASAVSAAPVYEGMARPWQLGLQNPATPVMEKLYNVHDFLLIIITAIVALVLLLLLYICIRFRRKANPVPSKTTHNTRLEIIWTTIPILILVMLAIPSLRLHYYMQKPVNPELTLKVVGYQWYWHYEYPDQGGFGFDSYIRKGEDLRPGDHRLLAVDNNLVVPVNTKVRVLVTGADVIHSWAVPAFGVKRDAVPGRLNETWFEATKIGRFYGQCSELCGVGHGFMPIVVDVVSKEDFAVWVKEQQRKAGIDPNAVKAAAQGAEKAVVPAGEAIAAPPAAAPVKPAPASSAKETLIKKPEAPEEPEKESEKPKKMETQNPADIPAQAE